MRRSYHVFVLMAFACLAVVLIAQPTQATAQETARQLTGQLHIFFDREKFRAWRTNTGGPSAYTEATAVPSKLADAPFLVMLSTGGCKAGADGNCNVTADYKVFGPDGELAVDDPGRKVWTGAAQPAGIAAFSQDPVPAMLESSDPPGAYRLHIVLRDNVAHSTVELERTLTLEGKGR
jgi:hypothetical protein